MVSVKLLSNDAPQPDGSVKIQGQQSVNLAGLYPSTRYQITVAAYLNKLSTTSSPVTFTTGPEGPAAPTGVRASADSAGNWTVSWQGCGSRRAGLRPGVHLAGHPELLRRRGPVRDAGRAQRAGRPDHQGAASGSLQGRRQPARPRAVVPDPGHRRAGPVRHAVGQERLRLQLGDAERGRHDPARLGPGHHRSRRRGVDECHPQPRRRPDPQRRRCTAPRSPSRSAATAPRRRRPSPSTAIRA